MFEVFKRYGHVDDVFIAGKRNVQGKRFGFATFMGVHNPTAFEKELSTICIGTQKLRCYIAKYQRNLGGLGNPHRHTTPSRVISPRPSFAAVLSRVNPNHQSQKQANLKATTTRTTLHNLPPPPPSPFPTSSAIVLELKSIDGAANTHNIFLDEGFSDFEVKYLGGLFLLIVFGDSKTANKAISNTAFLSIFKSISFWNNDLHIPNLDQNFGFASFTLVHGTILRHCQKLGGWHVNDTSKPSNVASPEVEVLSDSVSLIRRCNMRILSKLTNSINSKSSRSIEVDKIVDLGNELGFDINGKNDDVAHVLSNRDQVVNQ
ncbi:cytochrome P450 [Tanacetum coccineum]